MKINKLLKNKYVILDFWANWCSPCIFLKPIIKKIIKKYKNIIYIYEIDIDKYKSIQKKYYVHSIPSLIFIKNSIEIERHIGIINEKRLKKLCDKFINS